MSDQLLNIQPLKVEDFSGGITDYYRGNADSSKYQAADNFLIDDNRKLVTRPGSELYNPLAPRLTQGNVNVMAAVEVDDLVYQHSGRQLNYILADVMTEITGPSGNKVFPSGDEDSDGSFVDWNKHLFASTSEYAATQRVYKNESGVVKLNNLGLPSTDLFGAIRLANELKSDFNAHLVNVSEHTAGADAVNTITAPDADDYGTLVTLTTQLLAKYVTHRADAALVTPLYHAATSALNSLAISTAPTTLDECVERLNALKTTYNAHDANTVAHGTDMAHQVTSLVLPNATGTAGAESFIYAIYYAHSYYVNDVLFKETGPVTLITASSLTAPNTNAITLNNLLPLVNGSTNNWDTANVRLEIGRTTNGGSTFFFLSDQLASLTSFTDTTSDTTLQLGVPLYTESGILDNEPPPQAKYISVVNDVLVSLNVKEGSTIRPNRARFSKRFKPFANPSEFAVDFDNEITAGGQINIYPIVFLATKCYRLEGFYDENGAGGYQKREISTRVGCIAPRSVTIVPDGLVFAGQDGFYFTDGFKVTKISGEINETYAALSDKNEICGAYDQKKNIVLWGVKINSSSQANDTVFVAHANYAQGDGKTPFTTWSGGNDLSNFSATCLGYVGGFVVRGDHRGYLFEHSDTVLTDLKIDTTIAGALWYTTPIIYDYRSNAYDFGSADKRKWVSKIVINADNDTSLGLAISSNNDNSGVFRDLKSVNDVGNIEWGSPLITWDDEDQRWNYLPVISAWRRFPSGGLRCQYKQVRFTNDYVVLDDSAVIGTAAVDASSKTVTLGSYPTYEWQEDAAGYFISFSGDSYAVEYPIIEVSGADLILEDDEAQLVDMTAQSWKIRGYRKREILNLLNYVLHFDYVTTTQASYQGSEA